MANEQAYIEDQLLVIDAQEGDGEAMEKLVARWQKRLWGHAYRLTGEPEAAWEVTQQAWLGIIKGLRKLDDPVRFRAWAYRITTHKAVDWIRKNKREPKARIEDIPEQVQREQKDMGLKELLERLEFKKRIVLILYYFEQLSVSEIGAALRIPQGTVKSRLYKARKELKALWLQSGD